jgi:hypothetical protein
MSEATYRVSTWDHEADDWEPRYKGLRKWQLRPAIRALYREGWDHVSVQVCNEQRYPLTLTAINRAEEQ